ncbi:hypothetical protein [Saccharomonospora xinjiangensis]|uniref:Uncharacterized protein n=1 Tax=Saccharomonospora xinjiangensis XJ-54 TaxID=882086 RepID=I0V8C9_9PSEU|nr:hypothetical protein [Saccharomonospora xinjiangensis]EID56382.1 hypothetical protein SacxiDRAFT_4200 [Saccharomonospora xinjiangensis XJ-54]
MASPALWPLGDQLGSHFHDTGEPADRGIGLIESARALGRRRYHRQNLQLVLVAIPARSRRVTGVSRTATPTGSVATTACADRRRD